MSSSHEAEVVESKREESREHAGRPLKKTLELHVSEVIASPPRDLRCAQTGRNADGLLLQGDQYLAGADGGARCQVPGQRRTVGS